MSAPEQYKSDLETILSKRHAQGGDLWATADGRVGKGSPFSTRDCALMLLDLGVEPSSQVLKDTADLILSRWREDGRFKIAPQGGIYPCHTIGCARVLGCLGYAADNRLRKTFEHLLAGQHGDGGWRCKKFSFGRGPETEHSNPGPTLEALDAFRFTPYLDQDQRLDRTVEFLLDHWETRQPLGPCHFGIGSLFLKVEYPFFRYNLFYYVYVLSHYKKAKRDPRFLEAFKLLKSKLRNGKMVVENPNRKLADLTFCKRGAPSDLATARYAEIEKNMA